MPVLREAIVSRSSADGARWDGFADTVRNLTGFLRPCTALPPPTWTSAGSPTSCHSSRLAGSSEPSGHGT